MERKSFLASMAALPFICLLFNKEHTQSVVPPAAMFPHAWTNAEYRGYGRGKSISYACLIDWKSENPLAKCRAHFEQAGLTVYESTWTAQDPDVYTVVVSGWCGCGEDEIHQMIQDAVRTLRDNNVPPLPGGAYGLWIA